MLEHDARNRVWLLELRLLSSQLWITEHTRELTYIRLTDLIRGRIQFYSGSKSGDGVSTKMEQESIGASRKIKYVGSL
jgi:hypothetical protein